MANVKNKRCDITIDATEYIYQNDNKEILWPILC